MHYNQKLVKVLVSDNLIDTYLFNQSDQPVSLQLENDTSDMETQHIYW